MIAAHQSVLEEERNEQQEELEDMIRAVLIKVSGHLTPDDFSLLQLACNINIRSH